MPAAFSAKYSSRRVRLLAGSNGAPCSGNDASLAGWTGVGKERSVVGEPPVDAHGWSSVKPRIERQFLQVIRETIPPNDGRRIGPSQRITNLQIVLTAAHLTGVAPGGSGVHVVRIVHPLAC